MNLLLKNIVRNGNNGIVKPEPLRHRNEWSRRIDDVNRLVYMLKTDGSVERLQYKAFLIYFESSAQK